MSDLILTPNQARAVVGCSNVGPTLDPNDHGNDQGTFGKSVCKQCFGRPLARFVPSDTPDRYQPGEWVEVHQECDACGGSGDVDCGSYYAPEVCPCADCLATGSYPVGRVRLGEAVPVMPLNFCPERPHLGRGGSFLTCCGGSRTDVVEAIESPHLTLWPEAFTPGTYAHPIIERSPS